MSERKKSKIETSIGAPNQSNKLIREDKEVDALQKLCMLQKDISQYEI